MPEFEPTWTRRLRLLRMLLTRRHLQPAVARDALGCDKRQIRDDLKALQACGVPVEPVGEGRDTRWVLDAQWVAIGRTIDLHDRIALSFGRDLVASFLAGTDVGEAVDDLTRDLCALDGDATAREEEVRRRFFHVGEPAKDYGPHRETIARLVEAITRCRRVSFAYARGRSRDVRAWEQAKPLTLAVYKRSVYLFARPNRSDEVRRLAVERIRELRIEAQGFEYPRPAEYHPERELRRVFGITTDGQAPAEVVVRFAPEVAAMVRARRHGEGQVVRELENGGVELRFVATGPELVSWVLSYGAMAEVVSPPWLKQRVADEVAVLARRYAGLSPHT